jgi:ferric-dicitrate binding protein FerR (iron transport regulator)
MSGDEQRVLAACQRFDELDLKAANGVSWTAEERDFARRHETECEVCGALARALDTLRYDGAKGAAPSADELTARRVINGALEAAKDVMAPGATPWTPDAGARRGTEASRARSALRMTGLSAAVAALTALLVAAIVVYSGGDGGRLDLSGPRQPATGAAIAGRVSLVLVSGVVRTERGAVSLGEMLRPSEDLRVGAGRAAIRIGSDIMALLSPHTTIRVPARDGRGRSLRLVVGEVTVAVQPRSGVPWFAVLVADARVTVTGTIFSVRNDAHGADVSVLRGAVRVTAARQSPQQVGRSRRYVVGTRSAELLEPARERILWQWAKVLDLLRTDSPARLSLRTDPPGATVRVDGTVLGTTPVDAAVGEGQRDLELQLQGHTPVRERVLLRRAVSYDRDFQLARMRPRPTAPSDPSTLGGSSGDGAQLGWRALVRAARISRAARDWRGAARAYRELIRRHPRRGAARTALVSLGFIQLEHLRRPGAALASFRRYLAGGRRGALAREAAWGRILALGALGRRKAEIKALKRFLARYPRSVYRQRAARRLRKQTPISKRRSTR